MIKLFHPRDHELASFKDGPLAPHLGGFAFQLTHQGYSKAAGWRKICLVCDLSRWLHKVGIGLDGLSEQSTARFLKQRWDQRSRRSGDLSTLTRLLAYLREERAVPHGSSSLQTSAQDRLLADYELFLRQERGLEAGSVTLYRRVVRKFLEHRFPSGNVRPDRLRAADIIDFVLHESTRAGCRYVQSVTSTLRSFLGFLLEHGRIVNPLAGAVPVTPGWRLSELPRYLEVEQVERLLKSCDRRRCVGRRDFAILLLMARLGLRVGEVARLRLDDIDWKGGELLVHGKGSRLDRMPLPADVGQAIASYLKCRPSSGSSRNVFLGSKAPYQAFSWMGSVCDIVSRAMDRAGIRSRHRGGHVLRHSLATRMLKNGAGLAEIGQILRHQQAQTTEIYAKVDLNALRTLAQPWPGGAQ